MRPASPQKWNSLEGARDLVLLNGDLLSPLVEPVGYWVGAGKAKPEWSAPASQAVSPKPGVIGAFLGFWLGRKTLERTGSGPRYGIVIWLIVIAIALGVIMTSSCFQVAVLLVIGFAIAVFTGIIPVPESALVVLLVAAWVLEGYFALQRSGNLTIRRYGLLVGLIAFGALLETIGRPGTMLVVGGMLWLAWRVVKQTTRRRQSSLGASEMVLADIFAGLGLPGTTMSVVVVLFALYHFRSGFKLLSQVGTWIYARAARSRWSQSHRRG